MHSTDSGKATMKPVVFRRAIARTSPQSQVRCCLLLKKMLALLFMVAKRIEGTAMNIVHYQFMHVEAALIWLTGGTWY